MKSGLTILLFLLSSNLFAQKYSGQIADFKLPTTDITIFPFGLRYPIKIGFVNKDGSAQINLDSIDISHVPERLKASYLNKVTDNFFSSCDNPSVLGISEKIKALRCEVFIFWHNKEQTGVLYLVSDEKLKPWLEDRYYIEPVKASFFEILYVDQDVNIDNTCETTYNLESGNVVAKNNFNLSLKKGFNLVEYKIDSIHKTDPNETSSIPVKMQILNPKAETGLLWMVNYF